MPDTIYSGSVTDFRRELVASAEMFEKMHRPYSAQSFAALQAQCTGRPRPEVPAAVRDADLSGLMARTYAYTLAAVLAVAEREFGHEVAARLACKADDIITNGDGDALNADVGGHPAFDPSGPTDTTAEASNA